MALEEATSPKAGSPIKRDHSLDRVVGIAKQWLADTLAQEQVQNIGLEEISRDGDHWSITLGFSRPWDQVKNAVSILSGEVSLRRTYKVLSVDERTGEVVSMRSRD